VWESSKRGGVWVADRIQPEKKQRCRGGGGDRTNETKRLTRGTKKKIEKYNKKKQRKKSEEGRGGSHFYTLSIKVSLENQHSTG